MFRQNCRSESVHTLNICGRVRAVSLQALCPLTQCCAAAHGGLQGKAWMWELTDSLHASLLMFINKTMISKVKLFQVSRSVDCTCLLPLSTNLALQHADPKFVMAIIMKFEAKLFLPGDYILRAGTVGKEMFFITKGVVETVVPHASYGEIVVSTLRDGAFFGEIALLTNARRTASVRAKTYADLNRLSKEDFDDILTEFPKDARTLRAVARSRLKEIQRKRVEEEMKLALRQYTEATKKKSKKSFSLDDPPQKRRRGFLGRLFSIHRSGKSQRVAPEADPSQRYIEFKTGGSKDGYPQTVKMSKFVYNGMISAAHRARERVAAKKLADMDRMSAIPEGKSPDVSTSPREDVVHESKVPPPSSQLSLASSMDEVYDMPRGSRRSSTRRPANMRRSVFGGDMRTIMGEENDELAAATAQGLYPFESRTSTPRQLKDADNRSRIDAETAAKALLSDRSPSPSGASSPQRQGLVKLPPLKSNVARSSIPENANRGSGLILASNSELDENEVADIADLPRRSRGNSAPKRHSRKPQKEYNQEEVEAEAAAALLGSSSDDEERPDASRPIRGRASAFPTTRPRSMLKGEDRIGGARVGGLAPPATEALERQLNRLQLRIEQGFASIGSLSVEQREQVATIAKESAVEAVQSSVEALRVEMDKKLDLILEKLAQNEGLRSPSKHRRRGRKHSHEAKAEEVLEYIVERSIDDAEKV